MAESEAVGTELTFGAEGNMIDHLNKNVETIVKHGRHRVSTLDQFLTYSKKQVGPRNLYLRSDGATTPKILAIGCDVHGLS